MKKEINFDIKALNGAINAIGKYGGDKDRLNELQIKELEKVIEFTLDYVPNASVMVDSPIKRLVMKTMAMRVSGIQDPSTLMCILTKIIERSISDYEETVAELAKTRSFSVQHTMNVDELLQEFPKIERGEGMKTYEVIYTVSGALNYDEVKCDYISVEGDFVSVYKNDKRIAIYSKEIFIRAILL